MLLKEGIARTLRSSFITITVIAHGSDVESSLLTQCSDFKDESIDDTNWKKWPDGGLITRYLNKMCCLITAY